jgi:hypothetical protein
MRAARGICSADIKVVLPKEVCQLIHSCAFGSIHVHAASIETRMKSVQCIRGQADKDREHKVKRPDNSPRRTTRQIADSAGRLLHGRIKDTKLSVYEMLDYYRGRKLEAQL